MSSFCLNQVSSRPNHVSYTEQLVKWAVVMQWWRWFNTYVIVLTLVVDIITDSYLLLMYWWSRPDISTADISVDKVLLSMFQYYIDLCNFCIILTGYYNNLKVLYSASKSVPGKGPSHRYIPTVADRILDAPYLRDDYCKFSFMCCL